MMEPINISFSSENLNIDINKTRKKTNSINSNTSDNPNLKCYYHDNNDLITYCLDCSKMVCVQCIVGSDHTGHKYAEISKQFTSNVLDKFKNEKYQNLVGFKEGDKYIKSALEYCFNDCEKIFKLNCSNIRSQFKEIHDQLIMVENQLLEQLKITNQNNLDLKHSYKLQLDQDNKKIDTIINRHQNKIKDYSIDSVFNFETKQHIEIIKDSDLCDPIIQKRKQINNISFTQDSLIINNDLINSIKDSISNIIQIKTEDYKDLKSKQHLMMNKIIQPYNINYYLCHGEPIPDGINSIALDSRFNFNSLQIPASVDRLLLCNGFSLSLLDFKIPKSIKTLRIGDIKQPLEPYCLPDTITELHICDGFKHGIEENMIPDSVRRLNIYDIKQPLSMGSIPSSVEELTLCDGFNQSIGAFVIPDSVKTLSLANIKHRVMNEFIPSSVKKIRLYDGYNHPVPQNINDSIEQLVLFNIKTNLDHSDALPKSIKELHLADGFSQSIDLLQLLNLEKLFIYNILKPLQVNSIPDSVRNIIFHNYNHPLQPGIINSSINSVYFNNYNFDINNNIIPDNIKITIK